MHDLAKSFNKNEGPDLTVAMVDCSIETPLCSGKYMHICLTQNMATAYNFSIVTCIISTFLICLAYIDSDCVDIDGTYCLNHPKSKQYSEASTYKCREACKKDLACTGGYHWLKGDICYHFGVEGASDLECKSLAFAEGHANAFDCSSYTTGKLLNF